MKGTKLTPTIKGKKKKKSQLREIWQCNRYLTHEQWQCLAGFEEKFHPREHLRKKKKNIRAIYRHRVNI